MRLLVPIFKSKNKFIPVNQRGEVDHPKHLHSVARALDALKHALSNPRNPWIIKND